MSRPNYYFFVKYTDGTYEVKKVTKTLGIQLLTEIQLREPVKFAQLIKDNTELEK